MRPENVLPRGTMPSSPPEEGASTPSPTAAATAPTKKLAERAPAFYQRRKKRGNEICQILLRMGAVKPDDVRKGLRLQEEQGGQIGRILVKMGACDDAAIARALLEQLRIQHAHGAFNASIAARENPAVVGLKVACRPRLTTLMLAASDVVAILMAGALAQLVNVIAGGGLRADGILIMVPAVVLCLIGFSMQSLYAAMAMSPPDELKTTTSTITFVFAGGGVITALTQRSDFILPYGMIISCWLASITLVPIIRALLRAKLAKKPWWGHPVVVLGAGQTGRMLVRILRDQPERGLKPVMILDDDRSKHGTLRANLKEDAIIVRSTTMATTGLVGDELRAQAEELLSRPSHEATDSAPNAPPARPRGMFAEVEGVPVVGDFALAPVLAERLGIQYAILAMPGVSSQKLLELTERVGGVFSHLLLIPDLLGFASLGVPAKDVGGVIGIEVRQQLLLPWPRLAKRIMDVALTSLGGLLILPFLALLALAIRLDSSGPIFYFQERLGRDGTRFRAAKFRSMYGDGEARLRAVLESDPALRAEYEEFHKLTNDPRVTRVGRIVRKYSLDELPQLWNVLTGEMSLVGPRPYLEREIPDMNHRETIILRAPPGVTGLWQVSDRNSTGFAQRVNMDVHYVRNWSPWLDIYILVRTISVVLRGTGV